MLSGPAARALAGWRGCYEGCTGRDRLGAVGQYLVRVLLMTLDGRTPSLSAIRGPTYRP
ncbi:MAG: hypothetical protein LBV34_02905 [Nocardiopsaceae bacterium]|jgi:hypothetical protein|nr:hypothetical protein [Nocardiopsaceae bacterium]